MSKYRVSVGSMLIFCFHLEWYMNDDAFLLLENFLFVHLEFVWIMARRKGEGFD